MSMIKSSSLQRLVKIFPVEPSFAFAYGSKVKQQANTQVSTGDMIDLVLAVDDPTDFHRDNIKINPGHYSFLKSFGPRIVAGIQENFGAKVYYNTLVPVPEDNLLIKYGVIRTQHLINDLLDWETLYISGRLHKPVQIIRNPDSQTLKLALNINLNSAVHSALLMLDETFSEYDLYLRIAGLSYSGDFRMIIGEDKKKVENIVLPQLDNFRKLYQPYLTSDRMEPILHWNPQSKTFVQDMSPQVIFHHLNLLPKNVQRHLYIKWNKKGSFVDIDDVLHALSQRYAVSDKIEEAVQKIVWYSSWTQSLKGIPTAGFKKSLSYASKKLLKMYKSMQKID